MKQEKPKTRCDHDQLNVNAETNTADSSEKKPQTRREKREAAEAFLNNVSDQSFPNSNKVYVQGTIHDIQVGMREITLTDTLVSGSKDTPVYEKNEPLCVYDTSGFYTDENVEIRCA